MNLLIPVNSNLRHEAMISSIEEVKFWAYIELDDGRIINCTFLNDRNEANCWVDHIVVMNQTDYIFDFKQKGISVLEAPTQKSIDEIVEAFLFDDLKKLK